MSCEVLDKTTEETLAVLTSSLIYDITSTTAKSGGNISSDGGASITARGVCWSKKPSPSLDDNEGKTMDGAGTGEYTSTLTNLTPDTTYFLRAYATNSAGTAYGTEIPFSTETLANWRFL